MPENKIQHNELYKALRKIGTESVQFLTQLLTEEGHYATGNLIKSLDYDVIKDVDDLLLKLTGADYFKYVDNGRKPGKQPPIKPILSWVKHKHIKFKNYSDKQTAFVIARSIGKKGIKPLHATDKLINNIIQKKTQLLLNASAQDIGLYLDKIINDFNKKQE
jgi:hypothetical protein